MLRIPPRMTYDNPNPVEPMSTAIRNAVAESVVYDTTRKSIYVQGGEYGYIGNVTSEVTVRNAANDNTLTIILNVKDGVAELKEYIPVSFSKFGVSVTVNGTTPGSMTFEAGTPVTINNFSTNFKGTGPATYFWVTEKYGSKYTYVTNAPATGSWDSGMEHIMPTTVSNYVINGGNSTAGNLWAGSTYAYTVSFLSYVQDDRMHSHDMLSPATVNLTWYNHVMMGHIGGKKDNGSMMNNIEIKNEIDTLGNITNLMNNTSTGRIDVISKYKDMLSNNYKACGTVNCTNGVGTYLYLAIPKNFNMTTSKLSGVLGGSATQEFLPAVTVSYTNGQGVTADYDVFISDGQNWSGKTFVVS